MDREAVVPAQSPFSTSHSIYLFRRGGRGQQPTAIMGVSTQRFNTVAANWKCIVICFTMAMANCQYGLDAGIVGGLQAMPGFLQVFGYRDARGVWNIETQPQQLIGSCMNIGTILGVMCGPLWARYFGRRPAIWLASGITFVSLAVQMAASSVAALCVGRVLLGISNAFYITFSNVYTVEATPPHLRAVIAAFFSVWVNIGSIVGSVVDYETSTIMSRLSYQIPLATLFCVPLVLSILVIFIPESPRWLLVMGRPEAAERALERLRGNSLAPEFFKEEFEEMLRASRRKRRWRRRSATGTCSRERISGGQYSVSASR